MINRVKTCYKHDYYGIIISRKTTCPEFPQGNRVQYCTETTRVEEA